MKLPNPPQAKQKPHIPVEPASRNGNHSHIYYIMRAGGCSFTLYLFLKPFRLDYNNSGLSSFHLDVGRSPSVPSDTHLIDFSYLIIKKVRKYVISYFVLIYNIMYYYLCIIIL